MAELSERVEQSFLKQAAMEAGSSGKFEEYLSSYLGQIQPCIRSA